MADERLISSLYYGTPARCVIGNLSGGLGPARYLTLDEIAAAVVATGIVAAGGAGSLATATIANNRVLGNTSGAAAVPTAQALTQPAAGLTITGGSNAFTFALANDLAALEGLGSTGIAVRSAANTWVQRSLTAPAAGFTITNPAGIAGDPTFVLANDLSALEAMAGTGLVARTGTETYSQRTITGTASRLTVTNGDGVSGNPTLDISTSYVGQATITTLGTIATGTWQATKVGLAYGGTNADLSATGAASNVLKQVSAGAAITVGQLAASDLSNGVTGSGAVVLANTPTLITPVIGVATGTSLALSGGFGVAGAGLPLGTVNAMAFPGSQVIYSNGKGSYSGNLYFDTTWKYAANGTGAYFESSSSTTRPFAIAIAPNNVSGAGAAATPIGILSVDVNGLIALGPSVVFTTAFPALKRNATALEHRLADDSAYCPVAASEVRQYGGENANRITFGSLTELTTIAAAATTDTTITIPADAVVLGVSVRVTVAIPTAATFTYGVAAAPARYGTGIAVAANTTSPGTLDAANTQYAAATAIRITPNLTPAANTGRVRVTIHYYTVTPPTS